MPLSIKILEESRVAVPATTALPREPLRLCALDAMWVAFPLLSRVFIFVDSDGGAGSIPPLALAADALRPSLAETVARFPTLAGRIVHQPVTGGAAIDCTEAGVAGGVRFLVAEMSEGPDAARLAGDEEHDAEAFVRLVPALDAGQLPAEAMAAQVTRLRGGLALGVAMHHAVVDGQSQWRFMEDWAAACRGDAGGAAAAEPPTFDRAAIKMPGGEELASSVLRIYAPNLPVARDPEHFIRPNISLRTFIIDAQDLRGLKERIAELSPSPAKPAPAPSRFVAVAALAWVSFVHAKHPAGLISPDDEVGLLFFADCHARLDPPPGERYCGMCIAACLARATARDLLAGDGLGVAASLVAAAVRRASEDPLAMWDWPRFLHGQGMDFDRVVNLSGSTRHQAYEVSDFGWGPLSRTEPVPMNKDGQVMLVAGKSAGGVQASVALHSAHMDAYRSHFLSYLG